MVHVALLLTLLAPGAARAALPAVAQAEDPGFDLFVFVRSYSPTFCLQEECNVRPISAFTIHGLWPEYSTGGWPEFCDGNRSAVQAAHSSDRDGTQASGGGGSSGTRRALSAAGGGGGGALRPVVPQGGGGGGTQGDEGASQQQICEWPSFLGPNSGFWDHEWDRHGSCATTVTGDRASFFGTVMRLHEQYDIDMALAAADIAPDNGTTVATRRVRAAVEDAFSVRPLLSCHAGKLLEVWLCVGLDLKLKTCPLGVVKAQPPTCGKNIMLPQGAPVPSECRPFFPPWNAAGGNGENMRLVRIITGLVAAAAAAAAVALFLQGVLRKRRPTLAEAVPYQPYDALSAWCPPKPRAMQ
ncbi:ribonuclease T2 [Micractinium conductrix]|uniref:Ribonuclease T2 n=1 Tax=Micractinium conductrix TaxID=554055 RepID=A0A2P6V185_9CHLO|nr:ribonuclease T2 [Micractinium conductrix]|eukprot:PSC67843.1 ribonuclease T2 [Micractinium conductrix]